MNAPNAIDNLDNTEHWAPDVSCNTIGYNERLTAEAASDSDDENEKGMTEGGRKKKRRTKTMIMCSY